MDQAGDAERVRRLRLADPWGPLLAVAALVVFALRGLEGALTRDVAIYAYSAQQLADGVPPYVSVLNRAGPLAHVVPGLGALGGEVVGVDELIAMRATMAVVSMLAVWATYLLCRDLFSSRPTGAVAAATLLLFEGFVTYATAGPREKSTMVLFMVLALWLVTRRRWTAVGAAIALATLTWQGSFFPLAAAVLVVVVTLPGWRAALVALARVALGGTAVTLVAVLGFAVAGVLPELFEAFISIHLTAGIDQSGLIGLLQTRAHVLVNGFGWSLWVGVAGLVAALALGVVGLLRRGRGREDDAALVGVAAATVVCLVWSLGSFQGWPDAFLLLPFATVGVGGLVHHVASVLPDRWAAGAGATLAVGVLVAAGVSAHETRSVELREQRALAVDLVELAGPGATMQSVGSPQPLVLTELRNPIRYQLIEGHLGTYIDRTVAGGLDGIARRIAEDRPTFLVLAGPGDVPAWLGPTVEEHYRWLGNDGRRSTWYVTDTMSRDRIQQMRELLQQRGAEWLAAVPPSVP